MTQAIGVHAHAKTIFNTHLLFLDILGLVFSSSSILTLSQVVCRYVYMNGLTFTT